eukprot:591631-Amphidinium_carterae.1
MELRELEAWLACAFLLIARAAWRCLVEPYRLASCQGVVGNAPLETALQAVPECQKRWSISGNA